MLTGQIIHTNLLTTDLTAQPKQLAITSLIYTRLANDAKPNRVLLKNWTTQTWRISSKTIVLFVVLQTFFKWHDNNIFDFETNTTDGTRIETPKAFAKKT